ncbi:MAG: hypothetical protein V4726_00065 [Verrucomicrobiota bacterium]
MAKKPDPLNDLLARSFSSPSKAIIPEAIAPVPEEDRVGTQPTLRPESRESESKQGRAGETGPTEENSPEIPDSPTAVKSESPYPVPDFDGVKKTTVSFYATEQAHVDEILDMLLKSRRHRGGFSDAVKIALRLCPKTPEEIGKAWDSARAADKRTQKGKS